MNNFLIVSQQVLVLFLLMGVGFACSHAKLLNSVSIKGIVNILILLVTPCLIVDVFQRPYEHAQMWSLVFAFVISIVVHLITISLSFIVARHKDKDTQAVLSMAVIFANSGFMGLPMEQSVLGKDGVFFGVIHVLVFNLFIWSWGLWIMGGKPKLRQFLINPGTVGLVIGVPAFLLSWKLPTPVASAVNFMAGLNTPLAMIVIGYYLANARFLHIVKMPAAWMACATRLIIGPLILIALLLPFHTYLNRTMLLAIVIAASTPVAAMVSMFAAKFNRDVETSVGIVSGSTLLSIITMPIIIAIAMSVL